MGLEQIVNVQISRQTAGVTQAGFGTPLILGPNAPYSGENRVYTTLAAVAEDFELTDPEYLMASKIFGQSPRPPRVKIGKTSAAVAQVVTMTPTAADNTEFSVTIGDLEFTVMSGVGATPQSIVEALIELINGEEIQNIAIGAGAASGDFKLNYQGAPTAVIAYNATANDVQTALRALTGLANVIVTGSVGAGFRVVFRGVVGPQPLLTVTDNTLEDGATNPVAVIVTEIEEGVVPEHNVVASGSTTLVLTARNAGEPFSYQNSANLAAVLTTPNNGIANDIQAAVEIDNDWYFLLTTALDEVTVTQAALTIEAMKKIYFFRNNDADVRAAGSDDLVSKLKALNLFRSAVFYTNSISQFGESGWVGRVAPLDPGSETWANKTIASVPTDSWTDGAIAQLESKNANYYVTIAGVPVTQVGKVLGGEYIDVIRFIDWLAARMAERIFGNLVRQDKVPYTDPGIAVVETDMRAQLEAGVTAGGIASSQDYTVTMPKARNISANQKATRRLGGEAAPKFTAVLAGAIHAVDINGTVTL